MMNLEDYVKELEGTPYVWWREGDSIHAGAPFWREEGVAPESKKILKEGTNCAGFLNLVCRKYGIPIGGFGEKEYEDTAGGTYGWFEFLKTKNLLEVFDEKETYPLGTLLLRQFYDEEDQGHVAIVCKDGKLAHSYTTKGVHLDESYRESHGWIEGGYYTHICRKENWTK
jgi:cell wall-associated NlpC family hydrolase